MQKKEDGCQHYKRFCSIISPCCQLEFSCRLCHDENITYQKGCQVQRMDRHSVKSIKCNLCQTIQSVSNECTNCHKKFAKYFCPICVFYDNSPTKEIYHCEKCGICRIGNKEDCFHCDDCEQCYSIALKDDHECKKLDKDQDKCPICLEEFFYARKATTFFGTCKHRIHSECLMDYIKTNINCPLCGQSYGKEDNEQINEIDRLVEQSKDFFKEIPPINIWCHNCRKETEDVPFNYYGMKCGNCGSYNTKPVQ